MEKKGEGTVNEMCQEGKHCQDCRRYQDCVTEWMEEVYTFVGVAMEGLKRPRDYGSGELLSMVEMHTLEKIAETPGLRVSDIARLWNRTLGAASRNVDRLQSKGCVEKVKLPDNLKNVRVYPTERGKELARLHRDYDRRELDTLARTMLEKHSPEELSAFFRVLHSLRETFEQKVQD